MVVSFFFQFVSEKLHNNLIKLSTHINEEIHRHAMRALQALRPPPLATSSPSNNNEDANRLMSGIETLDLVEVLKI